MTRVLAVEDDEVIAELLRKQLEQDGYEVELAASGAEGKARSAAQEFDLVILDLGLPDMTGFDLARHLRGNGFSAPILMLTARDTSDSIVEGLDAGADDYLTKPFDVNILKARLRALMRRGGSPPDSILTFGDLVIDRIRAEVRVDSQPVKLTPKEYELLCFLVMHANQILDREDMLSEVWGINFDPGSNLADVAITRLRSKLKSSRIEIAAIRGRGYMLTTRGD